MLIIDQLVLECLGHHFQENGSLLKSEIPASTLGKVESVSTLSNWIPSQSLYSSTPLGVSVSIVVVGMSDKPISNDLSSAMVHANSGQPKISSEPHVTNFESSALSKVDTPTTKTSITTKPTNTPKLSIKKGHVNKLVHHFGPPPGFGPVPSRLPDSSKTGLLHFNPGVTPSNDRERNDLHIVQPGCPHLPSSDNLIIAAVKFPFPGKQVPSLPICQDQQLHVKQQQLQYKAQQQQQHQSQRLSKIQVELPRKLFQWISKF